MAQQPKLVATGDPEKPYVFVKQGPNGHAIALLLTGILGIVLGLVLLLVAFALAGNLPAGLVTDPSLALYNGQAAVVLLVLGAVLIGTGITSMLLWLHAGAIRH